MIEKLLSQERVLSILYDKTFPQQDMATEAHQPTQEEESLDKEHKLDRLENALLDK